MSVCVWKTVYRFSAVLSVVTLVVALSHAQVYRQRLRADDGCPEPGFFKDQKDCQKFYRCAELPSEEGNIVNKYDFSCPPGTIFDESISTCNHPYAVQSTTPECMAAVDATLREILERPDNSEVNQGLYVPEATTSKPVKKNLYYNVYQTGVPQHVQQQQQVVYQNQPLVYTQEPFVYQPQLQYQPQQALYTAAGQPQQIVGGQVPVSVQYLKK